MRTWSTPIWPNSAGEGLSGAFLHITLSTSHLRLMFDPPDGRKVVFDSLPS